MALHLTPAGDATRHVVLEERASELSPLVESLLSKERIILAGIAAKLLQAVGGDDVQKLRICRLCDGAVCTDCPIHVDVGGCASLPEKEMR